MTTKMKENEKERMDEGEIMEMYRSGDEYLMKRAKEEMLLLLDKYIRHLILHKYNQPRSKMDDMYQYAAIEILEGMKRYDETKASPTTYFTFYIRSGFSKYFAEFENNTSIYYSNTACKINKIKNELEMDGSYDMERLMLKCLDANIQPETITVCFRILYSKDIRFSSDKHMESLIKQYGGRVECYYDNYFHEANVILDELFLDTESNERRLLAYYFGLEDGVKKTHKECAKKFHFNNAEASRRQINKALNVLRERVRTYVYDGIEIPEQIQFRKSKIYDFSFHQY